MMTEPERQTAQAIADKVKGIQFKIDLQNDLLSRTNYAKRRNEICRKRTKLECEKMDLIKKFWEPMYGNKKTW
jgi:hypothetical protein